MRWILLMFIAAPGLALALDPDYRVCNLQSDQFGRVVCWIARTNTTLQCGGTVRDPLPLCWTAAGEEAPCVVLPRRDELPQIACGMPPILPTDVSESVGKSIEETMHPGAIPRVRPVPQPRAHQQREASEGTQVQSAAEDCDAYVTVPRGEARRGMSFGQLVDLEEGDRLRQRCLDRRAGVSTAPMRIVVPPPPRMYCRPSGLGELECTPY